MAVEGQNVVGLDLLYVFLLAVWLEVLLALARATCNQHDDQVKVMFGLSFECGIKMTGRAEGSCTDQL